MKRNSRNYYILSVAGGVGGWYANHKGANSPEVSKFFGPYVWTATLAKGRNVLEVKVANLLANALQDADRDRIFRDHPPAPWHDRYQRPFDRENLEGGLFGPVTLTDETEC